MKQVRGFLGLFGIIALCSAITVPANAQTIVAGGSITIESKVAARHYILVDDQDVITQIDSNTPGAAEAIVYYKQVSLGNGRQFTNTIRKQYETILPSGKSGATGTVYIRNTQAATIPLFDRKEPLAVKYLSDSLQ